MLGWLRVSEGALFAGMSWQVAADGGAKSVTERARYRRTAGIGAASCRLPCTAAAELQNLKLRASEARRKSDALNGYGAMASGKAGRERRAPWLLSAMLAAKQ